MNSIVKAGTPEPKPQGQPRRQSVTWSAGSAFTLNCSKKSTYKHSVADLGPFFLKLWQGHKTGGLGSLNDAATNWPPCERTTFRVVVPHGLTVANEAAAQVEPVQAQRHGWPRPHTRSQRSSWLPGRTEELRNDLLINWSLLNQALKKLFGGRHPGTHVKCFAARSWLVLTIPAPGFEGLHDP